VGGGWWGWGVDGRGVVRMSGGVGREAPRFQQLGTGQQQPEMRGRSQPHHPSLNHHHHQQPQPSPHPLTCHALIRTTAPLPPRPPPRCCSCCSCWHASSCSVLRQARMSQRQRSASTWSACGVCL